MLFCILLLFSTSIALNVTYTLSLHDALPICPTLLLLHGTGGTEHDLLPLANRVDSNANILSVKGNVSENGMARFFRRLSEGVFDEDDLIFRTKELNAFLDQASHDYAFDRDKVIAVGYSNGA